MRDMLDNLSKRGTCRSDSQAEAGSLLFSRPTNEYLEKSIAKKKQNKSTANSDTADTFELSAVPWNGAYMETCRFRELVAEWLNAADCKSAWGNPHTGSNPVGLSEL